MVESTTRGAKDYFHFGLTCFGVILGIAGVVTTSWHTTVCALVLIAFGLAYFAIAD